MEEVKKLCNTCRRYAKSERVLFHYNGHGVPKPTANGEIWLFNRVCYCFQTFYFLFIFSLVLFVVHTKEIAMVFLTQINVAELYTIYTLANQ